MWGWIIAAGVLALLIAKNRPQTSTAIAQETIADLGLGLTMPQTSFQVPTQLPAPWPGTAGQSTAHSPVSGAIPWPGMPLGIEPIGVPGQIADVSLLTPADPLWWAGMSQGSVFFLPPQTTPPSTVVPGEGRTWP